MKHEITYYWPNWLTKIWPADRQKKITKKIINQLGRGQSYLWHALNIYDDFLDGEGEPEKLPLANALTRRYLEIYYHLDLSPGFRRLFERLWTDLEKANRRETLSQKVKIRAGKIMPPHKLPSFPRLTALADKSLILAAGPLALMNLAGSDWPAKTKIAAQNFFRLSLAAKQLADDSQDWLSDLTAGRITAANVLILKAAQKREIILDLKRRPEIIYLLFAQEAAPVILRNLETLCQAARQEAKKAGWPDKSALVNKILRSLETALDKARNFQALLVKDEKIML